MEALQRVDAELGQHLGGHCVFDTFGDALEANRRCHLNDRLHHAQTLRRMNAADEADVDLDFMHRHVMQLRQRGIAGAEIVDGDAEAGAAEFIQPFHGEFDIHQRNAFGDFERDPLRRDAEILRILDQFLGELGHEQLAFGNVDRQPEIETARLPVTPGGQRGGQHLFPQFANQAEVFRHRNEGCRRDPAELLVMPARQRLKPECAAGFAVDQRLEPGQDFIVLDRRCQPVLDIEIFLAESFLRHVGEELVGVAALRLGVEHGAVGLRQQRIQVVGVIRIDGDAHAEGHREIRTIDGQRLTRDVGDLGDDFADVLAGFHIRNQQHELVTAPARQRIAISQSVAHGFRQDDQQPISRLVAKGVVDLLEVIQVEEAQPDLVRRTPGDADRHLGAVFQQDPVRQAGQRIMQGHVGDLFFLHVGLGHVAQHAANADDLAADIAQWHKTAFDPGVRRGFATQARTQRDLVFFARCDAYQHGLHLIRVIRMQAVMKFDRRDERVGWRSGHRCGHRCGQRCVHLVSQSAESPPGRTGAADVAAQVEFDDHFFEQVQGVDIGTVFFFAHEHDVHQRFERIGQGANLVILFLGFAQQGARAGQVKVTIITEGMRGAAQGFDAKHQFACPASKQKVEAQRQGETQDQGADQDRNQPDRLIDRQADQEAGLIFVINRCADQSPVLRVHLECRSRLNRDRHSVRCGQQGICRSEVKRLFVGADQLQGGGQDRLQKNDFASAAVGAEPE